MHICFFGVGGVGGYFGALLARHYENDKAVSVHFVARGKHKEAILKNGLLLKKSGGEQSIIAKPDTCTETVDKLPVCDIIVLSVKGYDLNQAVEELNKIAGEHTVILPLLNGVDIYERIRKNLSVGIVLPACVYVGTHIEKPGVIFQKGGSCRIQMGREPLYPTFYPSTLIKMFKNSGIDLEWQEDVSAAIWTKYMFIASFGLVTAAYEKTIGEILEDTQLSAITRTIILEILEIARKKEIVLSHEIAAESFNKARQFPFDTKTSFQRDVEFKGNLHEGDLFGGTLLRFGKELAIPVPETEKTYKKLLQSIR